MKDTKLIGICSHFKNIWRNYYFPNNWISRSISGILIILILESGSILISSFGVIPYRIYKRWKWLSLILMKFGTIVGLYEKLPNTKFEANPTSMSRVMAIWNFGLEAKISKIGLIQEAVAPSILKISSKFQRILVRIFKAHIFCFEVILISRYFRGRLAASNLQPRFSTKTPPSILLNFLYVVGIAIRSNIKKILGWDLDSSGLQLA